MEPRCNGRPNRLLFLLAAFSLSAYPQPWSTFLDPSRATDWTSAGFTIPNYTVNCATQPTLTPNSPSAAVANRNSIQSALASCNATQNVVNIPAGTYYVAGISFGTQGHQVLRGAGPSSTKLIATSQAACNGFSAAICLSDSQATYNGSPAVLPPNGSRQCLWTDGYAQGTTTITLTSCGGTPPLNQMIVLDQANDTTDTNGVYMCDSSVSTCTYNSSSPGNFNGRIINGRSHGQQQVTYVTGVTSLGDGSYSVTISPALYFTNIRSDRNPGAWWAGTAKRYGLENLTIDGASIGSSNVMIYACYECWVKNVASLYGPRSHVGIALSLRPVVRDSYFYRSQTVGSSSYGIEIVESSAALLENNIFQQLTAPIMFNQTSGSVVGYNFSIDNQFGSYVNGSYSNHNTGNVMNLWEGNNFVAIFADNAWGSAAQQTYFRNLLNGWASGRTNSTIPVMLRSFVRSFNIVGNVLGQPGYHTQYQAYATSSGGGTGAAAENRSIYSLGWGGAGNCGSPPCDARVFSSLMRWGNYDTVNDAVRWDAAEASPGSFAYVNANRTPSYFSSLAHTLPASLYYSSTPSWWPSHIPWPPIGPDVTGGNLGTCTGTYSGAQATASSQCTGGGLTLAWARHANSIPAQDCYLNVMKGPPDGTGNELGFDARSCGGSSAPTPPASPTGLTTKVQ